MLAIAIASEARAADALPCWPAALERDIVATARGFDGALNVYVKDLTTGEAYGHNALTPAYLASTMKLLVMLEVLHQVDAGRLTLEDEVTFTPEDLRDGAGPVKNAAPGTTFTVGYLLDVMMGDSDNAATDLLIRLVGLENVNKNAANRKLRFGHITTLLDVRRHVYGELHPEGFNLTPDQIFALWTERKLPARARRLSQMVKQSPAFTAERPRARLARLLRAATEHRFNGADGRAAGADQPMQRAVSHALRHCACAAAGVPDRAHPRPRRAAARGDLGTQDRNAASPGL